jgi:hypothetical protein
LISQNHLIPLALKLAYTLFVAVLIPKYWMAYSAWTFLYFCDVALIVGLSALWLESPLLMSMTAVGITIPQLLWVADLATGARITGMTSYMFDSKLPIFLRALSSFHGWLPFVLLWGVWRLGYDRRALIGWTLVSTVIRAECDASLALAVDHDRRLPDRLLFTDPSGSPLPHSAAGRCRPNWRRNAINRSLSECPARLHPGSKQRVPSIAIGSERPATRSPRPLRTAMLPAEIRTPNPSHMHRRRPG